MLKKGAKAVKKYPDGRPDQFFHVWGIILEVVWRPLGNQNQLKSSQKRGWRIMFFRKFQKNIFLRFWVPKWNQNGTEINEKSLPRAMSTEKGEMLIFATPPMRNLCFSGSRDLGKH